MRAQATKLEKDRNKQRNPFLVLCTIFDDDDDDDDDDGGGGDGDGDVKDVEGDG